MRALVVALHLVTLFVLPLALPGLTNRTKALWAGRRGMPIWQTLFDLRRLLRKRPVYSTVTSPIFRFGPSVVLAATIVSGLVTPILGVAGPLSFPFDFVVVAYLSGLSRLFMLLSALDTGSSFEGMGASREAAYSALAEPVLFLALGSLAIATGHTSFAEIVRVAHTNPVVAVIVLGTLGALYVVLQVEAARGPVDDPTTHLELTMIHEVMILDHSGPDLAALQYGAAIKLTLCAGLLAAVANPVPAGSSPFLLAGVNVALMAVIAVVVGLTESLIARLQFRLVPLYVVLGGLAGGVALLATLWTGGSAG